MVGLAPGRTALSHGRAGVFNPAYAGGNASIPFTNSLASYTNQINGIPQAGSTSPLVPKAGETMAETPE